jgi:hypothetical protein
MIIATTMSSHGTQRRQPRGLSAAPGAGFVSTGRARSSVVSDSAGLLTREHRHAPMGQRERSRVS